MKQSRKVKGIHLPKDSRIWIGSLPEMTEKLSCALVGFVNSLNPQKIIIGHEGYWIPDPYLCKIEKLVNERHIERKYRQIQVVKSGFKDEATVYGCTGALLTAVFEGSFFD